ncbi:hypothetical protein Cri9333_0366 [Crinalium epipsammum PCC 9333]|uniref:Uncharacterized protein n=1 Tax=Crinalium epipsammum PCC 9333 TaxID=1173022 RepID=K9VTR6_9CYAN|nr:hypothetical protein [Crinalium epipsammum]AFZ11346.1 hypothetical protein Cri9333_0366 [Crinalium epipsammum PCC 9333]
MSRVTKSEQQTPPSVEQLSIFTLLEQLQSQPQPEPKPEQKKLNPLNCEITKNR